MTFDLGILQVVENHWKPIYISVIGFYLSDIIDIMTLFKTHLNQTQGLSSTKILVLGDHMTHKLAIFGQKIGWWIFFTTEKLGS